MKFMLVDMASILHPIWHMSGNEPDPNYTATATVAKIRALAAGADRAAVCCDAPPYKRKDISADYKANRERDERINHQLKLAEETLAADGFPVWKSAGHEADDVVASAVRWLGSRTDKSPDDSVVIASADKDLSQLVDTDVLQLSTASGELRGPKEIAAKFGVGPDQMRDYLSLVGDSSDNIKGAPGIGAKRAAEILQKHGTLRSLLARLGEGPERLGLTPSVHKSLSENLVQIDTARKLVTLVDDLKLPFEQILQPRTPVPNTDTAMEEDVETIDAVTGEVMQTSDTGAAAPGTQVQTEGPAAVPIEAIAEPLTKTPTSAALAPVEWTSELEPRSLSDAARLASWMHDSRLFSAYGNAKAVLSTILAGRELGIGAMASLRGLHIIEGKPALSSGLMHALILRSGRAKYFRCIKSTNEEAAFAACRNGKDAAPLEVTFTIRDAERAGLIKPKSGWEKYPADMLVARAIARLARLAFPDVCFGLYTAEELGREDVELEAA